MLSITVLQRKLIDQKQESDEITIMHASELHCIIPND